MKGAGRSTSRLPRYGLGLGTSTANPQTPHGSTRRVSGDAVSLSSNTFSPSRSRSFGSGSARRRGPLDAVEQVRLGAQAGAHGDADVGAVGRARRRRVAPQPDPVHRRPRQRARAVAVELQRRAVGPDEAAEQLVAVAAPDLVLRGVA